MSSLRELAELTRVRVLLFAREPEALFWTFVFPPVMAAVLGFAFRSSGVAPSVVGVVEGPDSSALVARLGAHDGLEVELAPDETEAAASLLKGLWDAWVLPGEPPTLRLDPVRPEAETARLRVLSALSPAPPAELEIDPVTELGSRYVDFLLPGLLGMNLMGTGMWVLGFAIAEMRQKKLLVRLLVTPMRRSSFLASFLLARLVFLAFEVGVLTSFGVWVLDVPFRAQAPAFAVLCVVGAVAFSGLGLLACSRATTIQGASGLLNVVMLPMWLASGIFFSYERFPEALHPVLRLLPLSALNDGLRAQMLDGEGLLATAPEIAILAGWGLLSYAVALKIFRWR